VSSGLSITSEPAHNEKESLRDLKISRDMPFIDESDEFERSLSMRSDPGDDTNRCDIYIYTITVECTHYSKLITKTFLCVL